jgi:mannitol/fructose-specific phosphotransferase system IIA component (Ntr-type)
MKLTDFLPRKAIVPSLRSTDKRGAIQELVRAVRTGHGLPRLPVAPVVEAVLAREEVGSTGLGGGVAIPHARIDHVPAVVGAFGRSLRGIDFAAIDGEPVHLIFLVLSPASAADEFQRALKRMMDAIKRPNIIRFLREARGAKEIGDVFEEVEEALAKVT